MTYKDEMDYGAINSHRFYGEYFGEFINNWSHINRIDELIDVLNSLEDNEVFSRFGNLDVIDGDENEMFTFNHSKVPFLVVAYNGLGRLFNSNFHS